MLQPTQLITYTDTRVHFVGEARLPVSFRSVKLKQLPFQVFKRENTMEIDLFTALEFGIFTPHHSNSISTIDAKDSVPTLVSRDSQSQSW